MNNSKNIYTIKLIIIKTLKSNINLNYFTFLSKKKRKKCLKNFHVFL